MHAENLKKDVFLSAFINLTLRKDKTMYNKKARKKTTTALNCYSAISFKKKNTLYILKMPTSLRS